MPLKHRVRQLRARARKAGYDDDLGCPVFRRRRGRHVLVEVHREADGGITRGDDYPKPCAACGKVPEFVIEVVRPPGTPVPVPK